MNKNYINYLKGDKKSEGTIERYVDCVNKFISYINKDDIDATMEDFISYKGSISNLASATIALKINAIKNYYDFLEKIGAISRNPFEKEKAPKVKNKVKPYMTDVDMRNLLNNVFSARDKAIVAVMASTGLRMSEMAHITMKQWEDMMRWNNRKIIILGKGDKERAVYINDMAIEYVNSYLMRKNGHSESGYLFETGKGNSLDDSNLNKMLKRSAMKANLPYADKVTCHALRAGFATISSKRGTPVAVISAALGHSSLTTTTRYIKTCEEDINNAMMNMVF